LPAPDIISSLVLHLLNKTGFSNPVK